MPDKTLDGWDKICENCGKEFKVILREKDLGVFGFLGTIKKQIKTVFKPDNKKDWDYTKKADQHFCSFCLRKGDPIDWYCPRCKMTKKKCDNQCLKYSGLMTDNSDDDDDYGGWEDGCW